MKHRLDRQTPDMDFVPASRNLEALEPRLLLSGAGDLAGPGTPAAQAGGGALPAAYYVSPGGDDYSGDGSEANPWRDVQFAVDQAVPGQTVYLMQGLYNEALTFQRSGQQGSPIVLSAYGTDTVVLAGDGLDSPFGIDLGTNDYITIQMLYIRSYSQGGAPSDGIVGQGGNDGIVLRNLDINHLGVAVNFAAGLPVSDHNLLIDSVHTHDNVGAAIRTSGGMYVDGLTVQNVMLESDPAGPAADGINVSGQNITISNATIVGFAGDGIAIDGAHVGIKRVTVVNCGADGIALEGTDMRVENSLSVSNAQTGMTLSGAGPFTLEFNLIGDSQSGAAAVWGSSGAIAVAAEGNIFVSTNTAASLIAVSPAATLSGDNNLYYAPNVSVGVIFWSSHGSFGADQINNGQWSAAAGMDANSRYADPLLKSNYRPAPGSPAIDRSATGPSVDRDGRKRPVGRGFDLGPYEVDADLIAPTVKAVCLYNLTIGGGVSYDFTVTYTDNAGISVSSLDDSDVMVTGFGGFSQLAKLVSVNVATDGRPRTATYRILAPGGTWDHADDGTYSAQLQASQVRDVSGNFVAARTLGAFTVNAFDAIGRFGDVDGRRVKKYKMTDGDGTLVTFALAGAGTGVITAAAGGGWDLWLVNTDGRTSVSLGTKLTATSGDDGRCVLESIHGAGNLKSFSAKTTDLRGDMQVDGTLSALSLGNVIGGQSTILVSGTGARRQTLSVGLGMVQDLNLQAPAMAIRSVKAVRWIDTDADAQPDEIRALRIAAVTIKGNKKLSLPGDLGADVIATDATAKAAIGKVSAAGWLDGSTIRSASGIGSVTAGGMRQSLIFAGIDSSVTTFAGLQSSGASGYSSQTAGISKLTVKGMAGEPFSVINSSAAAWIMGAVKLQDVATDNSLDGNAAFGLGGHTLKSYVRKAGTAVAFSAKRQVGPATLDTSFPPPDDYVVKLI